MLIYSQKNWLSMDGSTGSFGQSCNETSLSMMSLSDDVSLRKKENFQKLQVNFYKINSNFLFFICILLFCFLSKGHLQGICQSVMTALISGTTLKLLGIK